MLRRAGGAGTSVAMIWLLPGMDGTGLLYARLRAQLGDREHSVVRYEGGSYEAIEAALPDALRSPSPDDVLVAESFGGPLAMRIAARHRVARLVLIASFVRAPRPLPPGRVAFALHPPPSLAVRTFMLGLDAEPTLVAEVSRVLRDVEGRVLAQRIEAVRTIDVRAELRQIACEIRWLRASRDRLVPASATALARRVRPELDVRTIDGPHLLAQRLAAEVAAAILED